ncbi:MAG: hypothetical protein ACFFG0_19880 [Candidatus Thorarchaeota archaeon]
MPNDLGFNTFKLYSMICKPLSIAPGIPGTEFSMILNPTNRWSGNTYSQGHTIPHYYRIIINILKRTFNFHQVSRRRRFFITSSFQILANKG